MKKLLPFLFLFAFSCKTPSPNQGKAIYGKNSEYLGGSGTVKCTQPSKRYTKDLNAKVKASIDSLGFLPSASIDLGVKQTVTRLSDYSSDGLDIDLILFRLCEISNNKGFSAEQTNRLFNVAIDAWAKKNSTK